ncbi:hypothetical protein AAVH_32755 [Aphelenchoides avenae]|nr:hypothetical protein AAVH_32755 [Aphelenchus avenae]
MGVTADDLLTLVPLLYAVPALFIYTAIILGMLRLEGTFYRLLAINGIYDCLKWFEEFFLFKATYAPVLWPLFESVPSSGALPSIASFVRHYLPLFAYVFSMFVILNRMNATFLHSRYRALWRPLLPIAVVVSFLVPFIGATSILVTGAHVEAPENTTTHSYAIRISETAAEEGYAKFKLCLSLCYVVTGLVMNVAMVIHFIRARKRPARAKGTVNVDGTRDREWKLTFLSIKIFKLNMVQTIPEVLLYIRGPQPTAVTWMSTLTHCFKMLSTDLHVVIMPVFLLTMSPAIRKEFLGIFGRKTNRCFTERTEKSVVLKEKQLSKAYSVA